MKFFYLYFLSCLLLASCGGLKPVVDGEASSSLPNVASTVQIKAEKESVQASEPVQVFGWWRSNLPGEKGHRVYMKLDRWDTSMEEEPHPDFIDIVLNLDRKDAQAGYQHAVVRVDFKIASYARVTSASTEDQMNKIIDAGGWRDEHVMDAGNHIVNLENGGQQFRLENLDFRKIINKYLNSPSDDWPWKMRIRVFVYDNTGRNAKSFNKIMDLIPGD
jgi:hypothetical protein